MQRRYFSFAQTTLADVIAHEGVGSVRTARVVTQGQGSGFRFVDLTEIPQGRSVGVHTHGMDDEEVYVIVSGRGRMRVESEDVDVGPGDVIVNPPGGTHGILNVGSEPLRMVVLDIAAAAPVATRA